MDLDQHVAVLSREAVNLHPLADAEERQVHPRRRDGTDDALVVLGADDD